MHRLIFGYSFAELVAPILLLGLTLYFLNKKKASVPGNADDADTGTYDSMIVPTETNSVGSSSSPTETNNNASSSLTVSTRNCYEVFLSFRGPDTRHDFTDHLYHGLRNAGIDAFRDDDELRQGENIKPELLAAIRNSKISIPIFSVNYGRSSWCLDELVQIMECKNNNGQIVLPIFYKVKPDEVRYQTGKFGEAFKDREKHSLGRSSFDPAILEKWKQALLEVSNLKGYEADGSEAELVESVVQKVLSELKKKFELIISENLVGIDSHVKNVMELLDDKSHACLFVGIHGMGGIGKTTLAKTIYNELSNQFEHRSFIADIRESWKHGVHYLQNQLIYDLLKQENAVHDKDGGINFISSKFKDKKVLLLLDDVDDVDQVRCLAGNHDWFSLGSTIIITTRNKGVLEEARVDHNYEHEVLDNNQSLILFSRHAFRKDSPPKEFEDLTREVVSITKGLPLSLEVLGSLLGRKKPAFWGGTMEKLRKMPHKKVREKLRISIEALDYNQKQIFLDIACFFIGSSKNIVSYMWDACGFFPEEGIEVLILMSLIKVKDDHVLRMHDQLRDLGREIVREENQKEPQNRSRLWDYEEVQRVLNHNKGTGKIEGINFREGTGRIYAEKQFKNLTSLRFLHLDGAHLRGDFKDSMEELRWLRWPYCLANFEVNNFCVKELTVLELQKSEINEKWGGWSFFKMAKKLKYLDLSYCRRLENTDFLSAFEKLEVLILCCCDRLKRIDASIEDTEGLLRSELCSSYALHLAVGADAGAECPIPLFCLGELPAEIGKLKSLRQLDLSGTPSLSALPNSIGSLENLEILDIFTSGIEELPNGIGSLRKLRELRASYCENLKWILVESMANLSSLRRLDFLYCFKLQSLPELPSGLTYLGVTCQSRKLPSLSHLAHLKELVVHGCDNLQCIQELPSTQLKSSKCSQPTDIEESESPQSLNTPFKLEVLNVSVCESIKMLDVSQFVHLRTLDLCNIPKLLEVRGLDKLMYLESLTIESRNSIKRLDLQKFWCLKKLNVDGSDKFFTNSNNTLTEIQGLDRSEFLERLDICYCVLIGRLDLPKSGRLKELEASSCENLAEIEGLDRSKYLESLEIYWCTSIGRLDLPKFGMLKKLVAWDCKKLAKIQGLDSLEYLESLDISRCTSIGRLDLPKSGSMKRVNVGWCKKLAEIHGLDRLESLEILEISWCTSIERLLLPKSGSLKRLEARDCKNLVEIQGLDRLEFLEKLNIIGCKSLKTIPELSGTQIYRYYQITNGRCYIPCPYRTDDSDVE
ncbi:hypothetical protein ACJRO7_021652 [Eucalyptus globulus]|uniref:TIR domain-containing protein n=1 Tax=Eucalyptus globulus TaxID=34317 RepID=A0ABD3KM13_EUCGL